MKDILATLRQMEKSQGEDYVWRTAKAAADEIERLRAKITKADYLLNQGAPTLALEALQTS